MEDSNKEALSMKRYQQAYPISDFSGLGSLQINKQKVVVSRLEKTTLLTESGGEIFVFQTKYIK